MKILQVISRCDGYPSRFDGQYVKAYDPTVHLLNGGYDGGLLETTADKTEAMLFADAAVALEKWRQPAGCPCHGVRPWDGKPNRPLTAFHCAVLNA
jgi:hypothetical protein